jgi:hypothetical protein
MRTRCGAPAVAAALLLALAACSTVVHPSPSLFAPTNPATASPSPTHDALPTTPPTERELSDRFWTQVITYAPMAFEFHTLEEIVAGSDLIVRGRIAGRTTVSCLGEASPPPKLPDPCEGGRQRFVIVAVDAVLKNDGRHASGTVMVKLGGSGIPDSELPRGDLVLFLKNYGQFYADEVAPEPSDSARWQWYFLATSYQGALRNLDGVVDVPEPPEEVDEGWWEHYGPFPIDIDGQPFDQVVTRIRELVAR